MTANSQTLITTLDLIGSSEITMDTVLRKNYIPVIQKYFFSLEQESGKKNIYRSIPTSDAMPVTGNINIVIILAAVLGNTSLRSGLLR